MAEIRIRSFRDTDAAATAQIFFDAVRIGARNHYDEAQRRAWAPRVPETADWLGCLKPQTALVAEQDCRIVGFMTLTADGCIDYAYVAPDRIGQGIAKQLYEAVLSEAIKRGLTRLQVEASDMARDFFERQGWAVLNEQTVLRGGVVLTNVVMVKNL